MNKKEQEYAEKSLNELFERDLKVVGLQFAEKFAEENKRVPTDKEMLEIIKRAEKVVITGFKYFSDSVKKTSNIKN